MPTLGVPSPPAHSGSERPTPRRLLAATSTDETEERLNVADQRVRLLHRGEVSTSIELRPVHDVVRPFGEAPDGGRDLAREHRHAGGNRGRLDLAPGAAGAAELEVEPR